MSPTDEVVPVFIEGRDVVLRPLVGADYTDRYLAWLNDPIVNRFSGRRFWPTGEEEMRAFRGDKKSGLMHLAVCLKEGHRHVGNVSLGPIQWFHRCAEVRILIGERGHQNRGVGTQSVYLLMRHAFEVLGLHRLEAGSVNPAFNAMVIDKLGWKEEGRLRSKYLLEGRYVDVVQTSILADEFQRRPELEAAPPAGAES